MRSTEQAEQDDVRIPVWRRGMSSIETHDEITEIDERIRMCERRLATLEPLSDRLENQGADGSGTDQLVLDLRQELAGLIERRATLSALLSR
jgi:hypothetical protein